MLICYQLTPMFAHWRMPLPVQFFMNPAQQPRFPQGR